jgi:hypothetical protein
MGEPPNEKKEESRLLAKTAIVPMAAVVGVHLGFSVNPYSHGGLASVKLGQLT